MEGGKGKEWKGKGGRKNIHSRGKYSTSFFKIADGVLVFINISLDWMVLKNDVLTNYVLFELQ